MPAVRLFVGMGEPEYSGFIEGGADKLKPEGKIGGRKSTRHGNCRQTGEVAERNTAAAGYPNRVHCELIRNIN